MADKCISCGKTVTHRQEAVQCDVCDRWCHRKCGTKTPRPLYLQMVRQEVDYDWKCYQCREISDVVRNSYYSN